MKLAAALAELNLGEGNILLAGREYDSDAFEIEVVARGAWANIKPMPNRKRQPSSEACSLGQKQQQSVVPD